MTDKPAGSGVLGDVIRAHRRRAGLTQAEAAALAGLSVAGLRDIEQGRVTTPRAATLRRLGTALGLPVAATAKLVNRPPADEGVVKLWIGVLGPLTVRVDGAEIDPGSDLQRALLGLLALSPNLTVGRDRLLSHIAATGRPATVTALAARMSRLRRRLRPTSTVTAASQIVGGDGGYGLLVGEHQLDLLRFRSLVRQARRRVGHADLAGAWQLYHRAVNLWRGEPLAGLSLLADDPAVVGLARQWPSVAAEFAAVGAELGHHDEVVSVLRRVVAVDPLHEVVSSRLMVSLAGSGRQVEALQVFDRLRRRLDRDLGIQPGPELVEAHRRVLRQEVGSHVSATALRARRTLPPDVADFIGRQDQLRWLRRLAEPQHPTRLDGPTVIVVEGMAGMGKTRLALRLAHQLAAEGRYPDQQLYADLGGHAAGPPAEPAAVLDSLLQLLGVPAGEVPTELPDRVALYQQRLCGDRTLLVLDDAAAVEQVMPLLPASSATLCLVTSRRRLRLPGAHRLPLGRFSHTEAVQALTAVLGAPRVDAEPEAVRALVDLCDRLPLAVGLIARRLQARPLWTISDAVARLSRPGQRLDELAAGGRSVRDALDHSYRRLPVDVRGHLRRLCRAGREFSAAEAAEHLSTTSTQAQHILDQLQEVHLLARAAGNRYCLHGLVRDYLREVS